MSRKSKDFQDKSFELVEFFRANPVLAAQELLFVDLPAPQRVVFEAMWEKPFNLVTAGRGSGKTYILSVFSALYALLYPGRRVLLMSPSFRQCVVGSTLVITEKGLEEVGELKEDPKFLLSSKGMEHCSARYKNLPEPTKKVTLESGFHIEGALDHRVLVRAFNGSQEYKVLKDLCIDDLVCLKKGSNVFQGELSSFVEKMFFEGGSVLHFESSEDFPYAISFNLTSKAAADRVQVSLLNLGIFSKSRDYINTETGNTTYSLLIESSEEVSRFYGIIGLAFGQPQMKEPKECLVFDRVLSIEDGFDYTYDFTVDKIHDYFSNGFISHNSKMVFEEVMKRYSGSPILREACIKKPIIGSDRCYLHLRGHRDKPGAAIEAYPLGTGEKVRGLRGHVILADEFAQIPKEIFDMVIRPMGAATASPMENVRRIKILKERLEKGIITTEDYDRELVGDNVNKIIGVSSAYYQFNHMYDRIRAYEEEITKGSNKYSVHYISYKDMPEGFLDADNIAEAKISMSRHEFSMEYDGVWESDSDGAFKASLVEKCKDINKSVQTEATAGKEYILGIDPARSSDAFAMVVIEKGNPSYVVNAYQVVGKKFPEMAHAIFDLCDKFSVSLAMMDAGSGGGGVALKDLLANEQFFKGRLIIDIEDEEYKDVPGRRILKMHDPKPRSIADANFAALNLLERGMLKFAKGSESFSKENETIQSNIDEMIKQMISIVITETKSGLAHFDIPSTGKGNRKKDLYSAFILAAQALYDSIHTREEFDYNIPGLVKSRSSITSPPTISRILNIRGR